MEKVSIVVREANEKKRRKLKSKVWDEFTKSIGEDGKQWAICNHCGVKFDGSSKNGTTHLKNHLHSRICRAKRNGASIEIRDLATPVVREEKSSVIELIKHGFDAKGYPTEHWDPWVLNSRKAEILQVYNEEKEKLDEFLNKLSCRFSLETVRVCDRRILVVHYIDDSWELKSKNINQWHVYENDIEEMKQSCLAWKIDRNICTVLGCFMEDDDDIESWFSERGSLPFAGFVPDVQGFIDNIRFLTCNWEMIKIDGLRQCVDYGYKTSSNKLKLQCAVNNAVTMGKKVNFYDDPTRRPYGPFEYLEIAVGLKEAFSELEKIDPDFGLINLIKKKWEQAIATFEHLEALKEFADNFCRDKYITRVVDIAKLVRCNRSEDCHVCKNASPQIKEFYDLYWLKDCLVLDVVLILDPRFKMDVVQRWYEEIYGSDADGYLERTIKDCRDVYNEYFKDSSDYKMLDAMGRPSTSLTKSELDLYLDELKVPPVKEFDILAWWRGKALFYPTLARMARDFLAMPISRSTAVDSTLPIEIVNIRKSEVDNDILPALIYLRGWL